MKHILPLIIAMVIVITPAVGQVRKNAFNIEDDQMVLYLDLKLSRTAIDSILGIADIKGANIEKLLRGDFAALEHDGWTIKKMPNNLVLLLKPLEELAKNPQSKPVLIIPHHDNTEKQAGYPSDVDYGVNSFARQNVHDLPTGLTRFFLPGNLTAKRVLLSGNFNSWSTLKGIMTKTDSGWIADVKLDAGEYLYKFIVNGRWMYDHDNILKEDDGFHDNNSIYFKYNYTFKLRGNQKAGKVMLTGSFNHWNTGELPMVNKKGVWQKSLYLREGTHTYNFVVDDKWITDPENPFGRSDGNGKANSVLTLGQSVTFKLKGFDQAKNVAVAGDFNKWAANDLHMKKFAGYWLLNFTLPAGNYGYKFMVDGRWMSDPANPHQYGEANNSLLVVKPTHTFTVNGYTNAKKVRLAGLFNNWDNNGYTMAHKANTWSISLNLKPGKWLYKYLIDGNWIIDPGNKLWEQNEYDTGNSVLWVEP